MKQVLNKVIFISLIVLLLPGCKRAPYIDVTSAPRYNFLLFSGTVWKTKAEIVVADVQRYTSLHEITLFSKRPFDPNDDEFGAVANSRKIAVLPVGTRVQIARLLEDNGNWGGYEVTVKILDTTNFQATVYIDRTLLEDNVFILMGDSKSKNWGVNKKYFESSQ